MNKSLIIKNRCMSMNNVSKKEKNNKPEIAILVPLSELPLTVQNFEVNDHLDLTEPSRHASASSVMVLLELRGCIWMSDC